MTSSALAGGRLGAARPPRSRARSAWNVVALLVLCFGIAVVAELSRVETSDTPLAPDNPADGGAMALATILEENGVDVHYVRTTEGVLVRADESTTIMVAGRSFLSEEQQQAIADTGANLVVLGRSTVDFVPHSSTLPATIAPVEPQCDLRAAVAAGTVDLGGRGVLAEDGIGCYPSPEGGYLLWTDGAESGSVTYVGSSGFIENGALAEDGNAALALHLLGSTDSLLWYLPSSEDPFPYDDSTTADLPPVVGLAGLYLALIAAAAWWWRGQRMGPLIIEQLPVVVPAAESVRGLANLYAESRDRAHAAQILRASTVNRLARGVGLQPHDSPDLIIDRLAERSGLASHAVADLLYGPSPTTDDQLVTLARRVNNLEKEILKP